MAPSPGTVVATEAGEEAVDADGEDDNDAEKGSLPPAPRFFTPRECARLQGFPEAFSLTACDNPGRFYHQIGNAVSPPIVAAVAHALLEVLESADRELLQEQEGQQVEADPVVAMEVQAELDEGGADKSRDDKMLPVEVQELLRAACPPRSLQRLEDCMHAADVV